MATVQQVLNAALVLNRKTQEHAQVSAGGMEAVAAVNRSLSGIYQVGARVNPGYHGATATVGEAAGTWARPANAELVTLIQTSTGTRVRTTTPEEPVPEPGQPCIVLWGRSYRRPAGVAIPTGTLTFWFSRRPELAIGLESVVDLEDAFVSLLVHDLGAWLAHRDERWDELGVIAGDLQKYLTLYVASLEHENVGIVRNVGQAGLFDSPSLVDLKSLLLAGSTEAP